MRRNELGLWNLYEDNLYIVICYEYVYILAICVTLNKVIQGRFSGSITVYVEF